MSDLEPDVRSNDLLLGDFHLCGGFFELFGYTLKARKLAEVRETRFYGDVCEAVGVGSSCAFEPFKSFIGVPEVVVGEGDLEGEGVVVGANRTVFGRGIESLQVLSVVVVWRYELELDDHPAGFG